jgi:hypothetical protein
MGGIGSPAYEVLSSQNAFYHLVGPYINGYAFGDLAGFAEILRSVKKRESRLPDLGKIYPNVAFVDRSSWKAVNAGVNSGMDKLLEAIRLKKDQIAQQRIDSGAAARFSVLTTQDLPKGDEPAAP